ncbi:MAG: PD-(D/E)XK nuclease family protein [Acidobacteria bacterium]|nr:PD-(D/E)XK nuclease family protein [Acidobacteriota bacterium]
MITPRRTRLYRVPDLARFRTTLTDWILAQTLDEARDTCVLVPTRASGEQLRRTVEERALRADRAAVVWPMVATRRDFYDELASRLPAAPTMLSAFEREIILAAVSRQLVAEGVEPPFRLRPGLVAEMLALYDLIRRLGRDIDDFERNFRDELEREKDSDRGASRLFQQTVFLVAAYRRYEARMSEQLRHDEHALRRTLLEVASLRPVRRVLITVADRLADPDGVWPADFDLLTRLAGLEQIDLLCTESVLAAGYLERLYAALPDLQDEWSALPARPAPTLVVAPPPESGDPGSTAYGYRDREEELAAVARRLKRDRREGRAVDLSRTALVVRRPLPYLYLARDVFADAAIPFESLDTLPLAAEPYAAAVDLALDAVASDYTRSSLLALLRSPHFSVGGGSGAPRPDRGGKGSLVETAVTDDAIAAYDFALAEGRYLGGLDRLSAVVTQWAATGAPASREQRRQQVALPAAQAVLNAVRPLHSLAFERPMTEHIGTLMEWLQQFDRSDAHDDALPSRRRRVRAAVVGALSALKDAYQSHDPEAPGDIVTLTAAVRRWLGSQTFATQSGEPGLQIVDAQAARYGDFDDVQIVGLIEGEWPERVRRNVLYPASLLALLEPLPAIADPHRRERDAQQSGRAALKDLLHSPSTRVRLSTFALENDAVVEPSILLDDVLGFGLSTARVPQDQSRVSYSDAVAIEPRVPDALPPGAAAWATMRLATDGRDIAHFQGTAGAWQMPRVSISRLEQYLNCPFKFYAAQVLKLEEQPEDAAIQTPLERGRFLHELWERFFAEWQKRGHGRIDPDHLPEARMLFGELCETALQQLPPAEAGLERNRLLGSAVSPGIAHRVFAMEAGRPIRITERLLEFPLQGEFSLRTRTGDTRVVTLSAKTDRIDLLEDHSIRVIDYKSKHTPDQKVALQLPIYALLARQALRRERGEEWTLAEAVYVSFEGDRAVVALKPGKGRSLDDVMDDAQDRLIATLDRIAQGVFPPSPAKKSLCGPCSYRAVCRLDIVEMPDPIGPGSNGE